METLEINFKSIFETLPGKHLLLLPDDPTFTIASISDSYAQSIGQPRDTLEGQSIFSILSADQYPDTETAFGKFERSLKEVLLTRNEHGFDLQAYNDEKTTRFERILHKPVISPDGEVTYIIHTCTDPGKNLTKQHDVQEKTIGTEILPLDFHDFIMQAPVAIGVLRGRDFTLEIANAPMLELWGKRENIIGLPIIGGLPEIIDQEFPDLLKRVYETGVEYYGIETPARLFKNGEWKKCYFNFVYSPLKEKGVTAGIMMIASEVTSIVESKKKLEESEKRYRDLIANATVATAVYLGEEKKVFLANESMLKLWGKDASILGKPLKDALPELAGQPFPELIDQVYKTGKTYHSAEDRAELNVNGRLQSFYFNFTYKALRDTHGKIYGILNMAVDVSATVEAKIRIKEAEERWRIALDSAELGTWDYYPLTGKFFCSSRTKELFGLAPGAEASFEKMLLAIHDDDRERVRAEIGRPLRDKRYSKYLVEYQVMGIDDKRLRWQRTSGQALLNENGEPYRLTGTVFDITERKLVEEALEERVQRRTRELLEANKELERSNHELEQYAYVASHDLQEPLRKILVYTDLIQENAKRHGAPDQPRLDKIMASAMRMSHLIQDLLNFSRLLKSERTFSRVDLNEVVKNVIDDFELRINETHARIIVDPLPAIEGSAHQMNQLFYNLINNALKFRRENESPEIRITAGVMTRRRSYLYAELNHSLSYYDITVSDNGIGFNAKYATQIFEIFKRLHSRSRYEGTGIGLALCRKIARNHRGDIFAESQEGIGSVFHVVLPERQPD